MILDKNGNVVANIAQPIVRFDQSSDYTNWKSSLPNPEDEKKFIVIKNYEETVTVTDFAALQAIPTAERKESKTYITTKLCGTLTQPIEFKYDGATDSFYPITVPIFMDNENYDAFISLCESEDVFVKYKLFFENFEHHLLFKLDFKGDFFEYQNGESLNLELVVKLPTRKKITDMQELLDMYCNLYMRVNGTEATDDNPANIIMGSRQGQTLTAGSTDKHDNWNTAIFVLAASYPTLMKWGAKVLTEDGNSFIGVCSSERGVNEAEFFYPEGLSSGVRSVTLEDEVYGPGMIQLMPTP